MAAQQLPPDALQRFTEWFVENYPGPTTIISDPKWHAPKVFRAAERALRAGVAQPESEAVEERDRAWILAMGHALGLNSGYEIPIVPEIEVFKRFFAALRAANSDAVRTRARRLGPDLVRGWARGGAPSDES